MQHHTACKDKTALYNTVDPGHGYKSEWISHGSSVEGASETWLAVRGSGIASKGEIEGGIQPYQKQLAQWSAY